MILPSLSLAYGPMMQDSSISAPSIWEKASIFELLPIDEFFIHRIGSLAGAYLMLIIVNKYIKIYKI